jgi:hypothetical protein
MAIDYRNNLRPADLHMPITNALSDYGHSDLIHQRGWPDADHDPVDLISPVVTNIGAHLVDRLPHRDFFPDKNLLVAAYAMTNALVARRAWYAGDWSAEQIDPDGFREQLITRWANRVPRNPGAEAIKIASVELSSQIGAVAAEFVRLPRHAAWTLAYTQRAATSRVSVVDASVDMAFLRSA